MCIAAPIALAAVSLASTAIGTISQSNAQRAQGKYEQQLAEAQAAERDRAGRQRILAARDEEVSQRLETSQLKAEQIARFAASGVDVSSGSPSRVIEDTAFFGEIDALRIRTRGANEAESLFRQGEIDRTAGRQANAVAKSRSRTTLLTGAGKLATSAFDFKQAGVF